MRSRVSFAGWWSRLLAAGIFVEQGRRIVRRNFWWLDRRVYFVDDSIRAIDLLLNVLSSKVSVMKNSNYIEVFLNM
jgi:hypothetical protein